MGSVARMTELSARSSVSGENAIRLGVEHAMATLRDVQPAWMEQQRVGIDNDQITHRAETYARLFGSGDASDLIAWIAIEEAS